MSRKQCPNTYEHEYWPQLVLGIDEAGRGPLAGPLAVAGVILPPDYENPQIYDSKALSEKTREKLYDEIRETALYFEILLVSEADIDRLDIYHADQRAMTQIARDLPADIVLTDAMPLPDAGRPVISIIKGDQTSVNIAAGSILAKVTRDRIMKEYDVQYPQYGFARNKGYGTREHLEALAKYGPAPIHRRSFAPVAFSQQKFDL